MLDFAAPKGINFSSDAELSVVELSRILCETISFIQNLDPYAKLEKYDDWWEHDGLHFPRGIINFAQLFKIINSPKNLLAAMSGNFDVFIGIAPENNSWYLRFYLDWGENEENLEGRFDVTFPNDLAEDYEKKVVNKFEIKLKKQNAETYYQEIIL